MPTGAEIGESSPCVAGGLVYVGDLKGVVHAVTARDGKAAWTFKTKTAGQGLAGRVAAGKARRRLLRPERLRARRAHGQARLGVRDRRTGARHRRRWTGGVAYVDRLRQPAARACASPTARSCSRSPPARYTGASPAIAGGRAYYGTFENEVLARRPGGAQGALALPAPGAAVPVLLVGRGRRRQGRAGRARQAGPRARRRHAARSAWTFATRARIDSLPADRGRQGLHRLQRRTRSTCSTWPAARSSRSSTPARPSPPRPPWPAAAS